MLAYVPDSIKRLKALTHLDLSSHCIRDLPVRLGEAERSLRTLLMGHNHLTLLHDGLLKLKNLSTIQLQGNALCTLCLVPAVPPLEEILAGEAQRKRWAEAKELQKKQAAEQQDAWEDGSDWELAEEPDAAAPTATSNAAAAPAAPARRRRRRQQRRRRRWR